MKGVRAFMPPQGLLLIAAYMPESWPVRFVDENIRTADAGRLRMGRRRGGQRHARAGAADPRHHRARARRRQARWCWAAPRHPPRRKCIRTSTISISARWATPPTRSSRCSTRAWRGRPRRCGSRPRSGCRCSEFPIPAYDLIPLKQLPDADAAVLERLSVSLRVLRHPHPLRPAAAAEDAAADHRRARRHAPAEGASAGGLFRRRQFHRQPQGRQGHAAASGRLAEAARLSAAVRLRGDAQHRQAAGNPRR